MTLFLPPPDGDNPGDSHPGVPPHDGDDPADHASHTRREQGGPIPCVEEILAMLLKLNGLVLLGLIPIATANVIQRNLRTVLDTLIKREQQQSQGLPQQGMVDLCRKDPQVVNLLEPYLTDQQIQWLMDQITDERHEQA